jgi:hypothetical protein
MNCDEITAHPNSVAEAKRLKSRNHTSALKEARHSHLGNSARRMTLYVTSFLPGRRVKRRNVIAMQRALSKDAREKLEPFDRNRLEMLPKRNVTTRSAR